MSHHRMSHHTSDRQPINLQKVREGDAHARRARALDPSISERPVPIRDIIRRHEDDVKQVYTVKEVADLTGYATETIRRHIRKGTLKAAGISKGDSYRISRVELADWWEQRGGGRLFAEQSADDQ